MASWAVGPKLPKASAAGNILLREKLPTPQGTSFPRPNQFHAHGYVNAHAAQALDIARQRSELPSSLVNTGSASAASGPMFPRA